MSEQSQQPLLEALQDPTADKVVHDWHFDYQSRSGRIHNIIVHFKEQTPRRFKFHAPDFSPSELIKQHGWEYVDGFVDPRGGIEGEERYRRG